MPWIILVVSGMFEAVWATALPKSEGFTKTIPILVFLFGATASTGDLVYALKTIPVGTSYAVWVGIGAGTTVIWAFATGAETVSVLKVLFIPGIAACVVDLKLISDWLAPHRHQLAGATFAADPVSVTVELGFKSGFASTDRLVQGIPHISTIYIVGGRPRRNYRLSRVGWNRRSRIGIWWILHIHSRLRIHGFCIIGIRASRRSSW